VSVLKAPASVVSAATIARFQRDGFAVLEQVTTPSDLARISWILRRLYRHYGELARARLAFDLGPGDARAQPEILEINQTIALDIALGTTLTFTRCQAAAAALLGQPVEYRFDHAIYKPPFNGRATAWHQDAAYNGWASAGQQDAADMLDPRRVSVHFWIPMQDVTLEMGCMQFIPGSHRERLRPHHRLEHLRHAHALEADEVDVARAVACPLSRGDMTVHFSRTLHYTGPNLTAVPRLAWSLEFGPRRPLSSRVFTEARRIWRLTVSSGRARSN
jgi:ectoine hydroxylase-related dioxygenase (phytanoyl-CoA dioxygenase family)